MALTKKKLSKLKKAATDWNPELITYVDTR